ncbi:MAG: aminoglycoside phosphotransferase family protein [Nocardioidaceae bacterium]
MSASLPEVPGYTDLAPLTGGHAGETFTGRRVDGGECVVLRVYGVGTRRRGPEAPEVQAGVLRLLRGLVPAPELVEYRTGWPGGSGLLVTTLLPGVQLSRVLESADSDLQTRIGRDLGEALGRMSGIAMTGPGGFHDHRLRIGLWPEDAESLVTWLDHYRVGTALEAFDDQELRALRQLCIRGDELLAVSPRACLVHGDLSSRNVLADPTGGRLTGIVDWEFAHAGHPVEDLGKLLRDGPGTPFARAAVESFVPWLPTREQASAHEVMERARAADLYWVIEVASRRGQSPATFRAFDLLRLLAGTGSLLGDLA